MKLNYKYIYIVICILLLVSILSIIHIQSQSNILETFENDDNLENVSSSNNINKEESNLVIDFDNPPGKYNTMEELFMKWTKKTPGIVSQSFIYNDKIYGLGSNLQIWDFPLSGNEKNDWNLITNNGLIKLFRINSNIIFAQGTNNILYLRSLTSDPKSSWQPFLIDGNPLNPLECEWFDIINNVVWLNRGNNIFTFENNKLIQKTPGDVLNIVIIGDTIYATGTNNVIYKRNITDPINVVWQKVGGSNVIDLFAYEKNLYALLKNGLVAKLNESNELVNISNTGFVTNIFIYKNTIYGVGTDTAIYTHPISLPNIEGFSNKKY